IANVAGLQLTRSTSRIKELAIRAAIGASATRLSRQLVMESLLLAAVGGGAGIALVAALQTALPSLLPAGFPRLREIDINVPGVAFAVIVTVSAAIVSALWPAMQLRKLSVMDALSEYGSERTGNAPRTQRARRFVMAGQIAIASVLLVGAALLGKSFWS